MKQVTLFRHIDCEGPGYLIDCLQAHDIGCRMIAIDAGDAVPDDLDEAAGLVFMGGSMSVNDDLPWIEQELALIRTAHAKGLPVLGHCLGGQLIAKALGAQISKHSEQEIGWFDVQADAQRPPPWDASMPDTFLAFHWHGETFSLPEGATPLLSNEACTNQGFELGQSLAFQCHIEMTEALVTEWVKRYAGDREKQPGPRVQSGPAMLERLDSRIADLQKVASRIYDCWIDRL